MESSDASDDNLTYEKHMNTNKTGKLESTAKNATYSYLRIFINFFFSFFKLLN